MKENNTVDLNYFIAMQESQPADRPDHSAKMWDQRAEAWKKERGCNRKGDERVNSAVNFLTQRGILCPEYDVADIGCGPGRFVAAFAERVHSVLGLDLSEKMTEHGMEYIREKGLTNAQIRTCDFQTLDIDSAGYRGAFDLVFSSMTPAIHGMAGLMKSIEMSRAYCCSITHLSVQNPLRERIAKDLFGKEPKAQWTGRWFYSQFNVLYLMGYYPETSYENRHQETKIMADEEYAELMMRFILPDKERSKENEGRILEWMKAHANEDGTLSEVTDTCYGRILWDVRNKSGRPEYRTEMIPVDEALNRVLARDYTASCTIPVVRASCMDGVAVMSGRFQGGMPDTSGWKKGEDFCRADTGDDFDDRYDAVIPIEDVTLIENGGLTIQPDVKVMPGMNRRGRYQCPSSGRTGRSAVSLGCCSSG